jgi:GMP synthase (glutamine-hydrolysing)
MDKIIIVDFGSQYTQLIARKLRELKVFCEIFPFHKLPENDDSVKGIILSGSPFSTLDENVPLISVNKYAKNKAVLGICYGAQLMVKEDGGEVKKSHIREYGRAQMIKTSEISPLFQDVNNDSVWMSHSDTILDMPTDYEVIAKTKDIPVAAFQNREKNYFGLQFHPEVYHSKEGKKILQNFIHICHCEQKWTAMHFVTSSLENIREQVKKDHVVMGISGGVDSTVAATLIHQAIGKQLTCLFIDNGLLRLHEFEEVLASYKEMGLNVRGIDAKEMFYKALKGVSDPELKRKKIGNTFIEIFEREAKKIKDAQWLGQGTIYPDVIESAAVQGVAATIKSHHNVGGLPEKMHLKILEPLRMLFKDEVRKVAAELHIPEKLYKRHPFPGPGLGIRILGEISGEKVDILQKADHIFIEALKKEGLYDEVWQAACMLLPVRSVGVMGDERTYEFTIALRAVQSTDGMTADWVHLPFSFLSEVSNKIINSVKGINRVVYDISSKPPATIEWE